LLHPRGAHQIPSRLSYADAFAVDLAVQQQAGIVTGDPEIAALGFVKVVWVGRSE
jgi:hypothetical protein